MRRHMPVIVIVARIFLVLSIVIFARAAPAVLVREMHEVHIDVVNIAEDGIAASQKRWEPRCNWLTNAADQASTPTAPGLPDLNPSWELPRPHSPRSTASTRDDTRPNYSPPLNRLPTRPPPPNPDYSPPSSWSAGSSPSSPDYSPPGSWLTDNSPPSSSSTGSPPSNLDYSPPSSWSTDHSSSSSWSTDHSSSSSWSINSPQNPGLTDGHSPSPPSLSSVLSTGSTGSHPSTDNHPPPSPEPARPVVHEPEGFLDMLLKGKIKRRTAGSSVVCSAQGGCRLPTRG